MTIFTIIEKPEDVTLSALRRIAKTLPSPKWAHHILVPKQARAAVLGLPNFTACEQYGNWRDAVPLLPFEVGCVEQFTISVATV